MLTTILEVCSLLLVGAIIGGLLTYLTCRWYINRDDGYRWW